MKKTKILKSLVIALTFLFTMALTFGITVAAYNTSRTADGTLTMDNGIVINYTGFGKVQDGEWEKEQTTTFKLFENRDILPGDTINLNPAAIQKGSNSVDYYVRIKFEYKFYDALNADITSQIADYSAFLSTPTFNSAWVNGNNNDGWFYYATGTTLNALPTSYVNIFDGAQSINVALNADGFNHQGGGYKYSEQITITKIEATLTLEALQTTGSTWEIIPLVQNSSSQVIEIQSNEITLGNVGGAYKLGTGEAGTLSYDTTTLGTTLKIIVAGNSQINANAFNGSDLTEVYIGDQDYINGVSSYAAKIYSSPATFKIGANAFAGCTNLNVYLSSSCNYEIYASSLAGVNNVYYDGVLNNSLKNPSVGAVAGTTITVSAKPSIVTGGTGAGSVNNSNNSSYGAYTYEDALGNIWYFDLIDNNTQAEIKHCNTSTGSLIIPSQVSSFSELTGSGLVTAIGSNAFFFCQDLTSITIPASVTSIVYGAFKNCTGLTSITIPSSVISIGQEVFYGCSSLASFSGGNAKYTISFDSRCLIENDGNEHRLISFAPSGLTYYNIPNYITSISDCVFMDCTGLTSIEIPESVALIASYAFQGCTGLTQVTIPDSVTNIYSYVFFNCTGLTQFISNNSKYTVSADGRCLIENYGTNHKLIAFAPSGLTSYTIPDSVTSIGGWTFRRCTGLIQVTIPNSVTSIGDSAFYDCTGLTQLTIGSSVTLISPSAFYGCTGLTSVTIPNSVTSIGSSAFCNCTGLTTVVINANITSVPSSCFRGCTNLQNLTLPVSVTSISSNAFNNCSSLTSINWSASYNLGAEKNNEVVTLVKATTGLTLGDINLPDAADLAAASITAPTGKVFAGWTDGETTYTTTAPIAKVRAGLTAVWVND